LTQGTLREKWMTSEELKLLKIKIAEKCDQYRKKLLETLETDSLISSRARGRIEGCLEFYKELPLNPAEEFFIKILEKSLL